MLSIWDRIMKSRNFELMQSKTNWLVGGLKAVLSIAYSNQKGVNESEKEKVYYNLCKFFLGES